MGDAQLAAVAGLLGVGLSGGVQVGLAIRADRHETRRATRLIESELGELYGRLRMALIHQDWLHLLAAAPETPVWDARREDLAKHLSRRKWLLVATAYSSYALAVSVAGVQHELGRSQTAEGSRALAETVGAAANQVKTAIRALRPVSAWFGLREVEQLYERLARDQRDSAAG